MAATDQQVQAFSDVRCRPHAEVVRDLHTLIVSALAQITDVYDACIQQNPTWSDNRNDGPPHLVTPSDILAWNTFMVNLKAAIENDAQWPIIQKFCVRPG